MQRDRLLLFLAVLAPAALSLRCSFSGVVAPPAPEHPTVEGASPLDAGDALDAATLADAEAPDTLQASPQQGSPLCNASLATGCYPDMPTPAQACPIDAGAPASSAAALPDASLACRVVADSDGVSPHPVCAAAGDLTSGQTCVSSNDCAPGLDCVVSGETATCAPYCCKGNSACESTQFCDVEPLANAMATNVPVCVAMRNCALLSDAPGNCAPGETCSVVRDDGSKSCVGIGAANAGDSCDEQHCGADLACIGVPGKRTCFQLCHTATGAECPPNKICEGAMPLFVNPAFGICMSPENSP